MYVLDSSVFIAVMKSERGSEGMLEYLEDSLVCAINLSEVLQKFAQLGGSTDTAAGLIASFGCQIVVFDHKRAAETAALWQLTTNRGLSLADRCCLSLARAVKGIAVTTDRAWGNIDVPGLDVHVIERTTL